MLHVLSIGLALQFGGKPPRPPKLEAVVERAEWRGKGELAVSVLVRNVGDGEVRVDPAMLSGGGELVMFVLTDENGKRVRFKGDDIASYAPLAPERAVPLWHGLFLGLETTLNVPKPSKRLFVQVVFGYPDLKSKTNVWTGQVRSKAVEASGHVGSPGPLRG